MDDGSEPVRQPGRFQGQLPVLDVYVEPPALPAGVGGRLGLVDRRRGTLEVQHAGKDQVA